MRSLVQGMHHYILNSYWDYEDAWNTFPARHCSLVSGKILYQLDDLGFAKHRSISSFT